jgi:hypothetical protein
MQFEEESPQQYVDIARVPDDETIRKSGTDHVFAKGVTRDG